jgi:ribonuclease P protein component
VKRRYVLRGRGAFSRVFALGHRLEGSLVRAVLLVERPSDAGVRIGYSISSRRYNAVTRNRLRRLMREAVIRELPVLASSVCREGCAVSVVFVWRSSPSVDVRRLGHQPVASDVSRLCNQVVKLCSKVQR